VSFSGIFQGYVPAEEHFSCKKVGGTEKWRFPSMQTPLLSQLMELKIDYAWFACSLQDHAGSCCFYMDPHFVGPGEDKTDRREVKRQNKNHVRLSVSKRKKKKIG
jgi:hypothetical protein